MVTEGNIVGKATEKLGINNSCQIVSSIEEITWPEDDGKNSLKPCFLLPDGTYVGKIMVMVSLSWFNPKANILIEKDSKPEIQNLGNQDVKSQIIELQTQIETLKSEFCKKDNSSSFCE